MSNRENLVKAAKELLWERGYEAMSPKAIQQHSGTGQGSFYHHFEGKADLATAALSEVADEMRNAFNKLLSPEKEPLTRIMDYLTAPRDALRGCRLGRMVHEPGLMQGPLREPVSSYFAYAEQELTAALKDAQQCGALSHQFDAADLAATILAVLQGGYVLARALQEPEQMERATRGAVTLLFAVAQKGSVNPVSTKETDHR